MGPIMTDLTDQGTGQPQEVLRFTKLHFWFCMFFINSLGLGCFLQCVLILSTFHSPPLSAALPPGPHTVLPTQVYILFEKSLEDQFVLPKRILGICGPLQEHG